MDRPELTWERFNARLEDSEITDLELIALLSVLNQVEMPERASKLQHLVDHIRLCVRYAQQTKDWKPTDVAKEASRQLVRACLGLILELENLQMSWDDIPMICLNCFANIVDFYAEQNTLDASEPDQALVHEFLERLWFYETTTERGHISVTKIERALVSVEDHLYLLNHHCMRAIPELASALTKSVGLNMEGHLQWSGWSYFPIATTADGHYWVTPAQERLILTAMQQNDELFLADVIYMMLLPGKPSDPRYQTLMSLIAHAVHVRTQISDSGLDSLDIYRWKGYLPPRRWNMSMTESFPLVMHHLSVRTDMNVIRAGLNPRAFQWMEDPTPPERSPDPEVYSGLIYRFDTLQTTFDFYWDWICCEQKRCWRWNQFCTDPAYLRDYRDPHQQHWQAYTRQWFTIKLNTNQGDSPEVVRNTVANQRMGGVEILAVLAQQPEVLVRRNGKDRPYFNIAALDFGPISTESPWKLTPAISVDIRTRMIRMVINWLNDEDPRWSCPEIMSQPTSN